MSKEKKVVEVEVKEETTPEETPKENKLDEEKE